VRLDERDRRIVAIGVPALATVLIEPVYTLVDTAIVGHLGVTPLAGLALAASVLTASFWVFNFLSFGTTSRVAFLTGRRETRGAAGVAAQGLYIAVVLGVVVGALLAVLAPGVAGVMGGHGGVESAAVTYLRISAIGTPFALIALVGNGFLRGVSDTRTPLRIVLVSNAANVVFEVALVYGAHFGVAGSAWGTVAAQGLAAGWFMLLLAQRIAAAGASLRPDGVELRRMATVGKHLFVRTGALLAALTLSTSVVSRLGAVPLAAHQVALQVWLFVTAALDGLAIPAQAIVGTELGAGDPANARAYAQRLLVLGTWVGAGLGAVLAIITPLLAGAFTSSAPVARAVVGPLLIVAGMQVLDAIVFVLDGVLMGAGDFAFLRVSTLSGLLVFTPVAVAVLEWPRLGLVTIWLGLVGWLLARCAVNTTRYRSERWTAIAAAEPVAL
jgi:putative MATE family efflux protein